MLPEERDLTREDECNMFHVHHKGSFNNIELFFNRALRKDYLNIIAEYGKIGVQALKAATPVDTGATRDAWDFEIVEGRDRTTLYFTNSEEDNGANVAILLIYGHGTRNGGYVEGKDFLSPALVPVFENLADAVWKEVTE